MGALVWFATDQDVPQPFNQCHCNSQETKSYCIIGRGQPKHVPSTLPSVAAMLYPLPKIGTLWHENLGASFSSLLGLRGPAGLACGLVDHYGMLILLSSNTCAFMLLEADIKQKSLPEPLASSRSQGQSSSCTAIRGEERFRKREC